YRFIESFAIESGVPTWTFALGDALLARRIWMARDRNTTYVMFTLLRASEPLSLEVRPLCTSRDYHWHRRGPGGLASETIAGGCAVGEQGQALSLRLIMREGQFVHSPDWYWNFHHRVEAARGLDSNEDLYVPGCFTLSLSIGESTALTATCESEVPAPAAQALADVRAHAVGLLRNAAVGLGPQPAWIEQLVLAADQFIVARGRKGIPGTGGGATVIAGYPWFADWGRDTMVALPGLTLATGRPKVAAEILRTFGQHVDQGLLPNRFPDQGEAPEYNTVDATLWYFIAIHEYLETTEDWTLADELYPTLREIIDWHQRGTRHGIVVDAADGLLRSGEPGMQLTWMDAKVGDWVVTPRTGKPVEINALWCNALAIVADIAARRGDQPQAAAYHAAAAHAAESFGRKFWCESLGHLHDVIEVGDRQAPDSSLRPNQLLAVSLPYALLEPDRARAVLKTCERQLITSFGLRTLQPHDPAYIGHYGGDQRSRDGAYHQGTAWPWLLGPFVRAHLRLFRDVPLARSFLEPMAQQMTDACVGQISEIFDGEAPHSPQGCFAQAWSVAEVLRAWEAIEEHASMTAPPAAARKTLAAPTRSSRKAR
ncbi:MAG TPA: amylo-alpha-1,6-glucosidase, partial [Steroidobacteraceae bacterium]|nr:amylo-alpha-1,6-glucosidase [Steroidobacteraceae bacterium]